MNSRIPNRPLTILVIEDSPGDVELIKTGFKQSPVEHHLYVVPDGYSAIEFLLKEGAQSDTPRPDLVILDINLPGMTGHEVLAKIRATESIKKTPVIILSSSSNKTDIEQSYKMNVNSYVTKPMDLQDFLMAIKSIESFWLSIAELPS
jgi:two-component system, chemotaxis family, response regulator Rcp1